MLHDDTETEIRDVIARCLADYDDHRLSADHIAMACIAITALRNAGYRITKGQCAT